jgi:hypothetical protein
MTSLAYTLPLAAMLALCWAASVMSWPDGAALYPCCCPNNRKCHDMGTCFYCRNPDYSCNCSECSCYVDNNENVTDNLFKPERHHRRGERKDYYLRRHKASHARRLHNADRLRHRRRRSVE